MKTAIKYTILILLGVLAFTSCRKEESPFDTNRKPILAPVESMLMDYSNFRLSAKKSVATSEKSSIDNWITSALALGTWNMRIDENLAVPVGAFREAFNHPDVLVGNTTWAKTYSLVINGIAYNCKLEGNLDKNNYSTQWKMFVTKIADDGSSYSDFLFFSGITSADGNSAVWHLNRGPEFNGNAYLNIEWVRNISLKYTLVDTAEINDGSVLEYRKINDPGLNNQFILRDANRSSDITIQWNSTNRNGKVQSKQWYNNADWHCWSENYLNTLCN